MMELTNKDKNGWEDRSHKKNHKDAPHGLVAAHLNETYSVQRFVHLTPVGFVDHLMVRRHDDQPIQSWKDLQKIKNELTDEGPKRIGVQVFPREDQLVDQANMYHIYVYPKGHQLPFNLKDQNP